MFLRAYRALGGFRGQSSLATWLYRIGVNVCLNRVSAQTAADRADRGKGARGHDVGVAVGTRHARGAGRARARRRRRLPEKQRAALVLRVYQDMTHQEIAATLGTSVGAAKANVFHALRNLKRLLADEGL